MLKYTGSKKSLKSIKKELGVKKKSKWKRIKARLVDSSPEQLIIERGTYILNDSPRPAINEVTVEDRSGMIGGFDGDGGMSSDFIYSPESLRECFSMSLPAEEVSISRGTDIPSTAATDLWTNYVERCKTKAVNVDCNIMDKLNLHYNYNKLREDLYTEYKKWIRQYQVDPQRSDDPHIGPYLTIENTIRAHVDIKFKLRLFRNVAFDERNEL